METARPRMFYLPSPYQSHVESPQSPEMLMTQDDLKKSDSSSDQSTSSGVLSPFFPAAPALERKCTASLVGDKYLILDIPEGSTLNKCINVQTQEELVCKVIGREAGGLLSAHYRMDGHPHVNSLREVLMGDKLLYLVFPPSKGGDLHSHVRLRKRLREPVARKLFRQMVHTVKACHEKGIVLRDLKLRKFVFSDTQKTHIKLETLEDAVVLDNPEDDMLHDKRGCPAYVSPEILRSHVPYSGKAADMWSLGVILFTMLVGRRILLDTGEADVSEYATHLKQVLKEENASIHKIVVTHWHHDHIGGVPSVLKLNGKCEVTKLKRDDFSDEPLIDDIPVKFLQNEEIIETEGASLKVYHTPGHTTDHIVLVLKEENALFSGDCILGEGTAVFENLFDYMKSLELILKLEPKIIYPGHGPVIEDPLPKIKFYIDHRKEREKQILKFMERNIGKKITAGDIVKNIYKETPEHLYKAAEINVGHHLSKLEKEGMVRNEKDGWTLNSLNSAL